MWFHHVDRYKIDHAVGNNQFYSSHIRFGNQQIFSGAYYKLAQCFHEYKIMRANITIRWECKKNSGWVSSNPQSAQYSVASFLEDYDADDEIQQGVTFDQLISHPETRASQVSTGQRTTTRHVWYPTEPEDRDWRLTTNDGAFHIYLCAAKDDDCTVNHTATAVVDAWLHLGLRGINSMTVREERSVLRSAHRRAQELAERLPASSESTEHVEAFETLGLESLGLDDDL